MKREELLVTYEKMGPEDANLKLYKVFAAIVIKYFMYKNGIRAGKNDQICHKWEP